MTIRKFIRMLTLFMSLIAGFGFCLTSEAANTLPPGMVIGDSNGIYASDEGEYGIDLDNLLPGETHEKEITIRSLDLEEPFSLGLLVEPISSEGPIAWEDHIEMTLTLDGEEIYQGPLLGDGSFDWTKTPLELGVCKYGTDKLLKATFITDRTLSMDQFREASELTFYWTFVGTKDQQPTTPSESEPPTSSTSEEPVTPGEPQRPNLPDAGGTGILERLAKRLPQTGEEVRDALYKVLAGLLMVLIALFLWKKQREEEKE
ncbi:LPXTG cell wall anchor domain-containing protein [Enterococcus sp. 669A]|uniref:LPXTG cell wall anchor domain-containing protein n=1 Tax=Candidatus Enterococcus moelleringii TaxID=2815325 RepID=A0ABS3L810_9ENTE|nr:LPXTG cell wall anchor domain-containing protein [Enterococcus sp. 669A]MBO1305747.1 LPXTG cell wall anchor domain-containing protein [Enterococcus sp. 669A]